MLITSLVSLCRPAAGVFGTMPAQVHRASRQIDRSRLDHLETPMDYHLKWKMQDFLNPRKNLEKYGSIERPFDFSPPNPPLKKQSLSSEARDALVGGSPTLTKVALSKTREPKRNEVLSDDAAAVLMDVSEKPATSSSADQVLQQTGHNQIDSRMRVVCFPFSYSVNQQILSLLLLTV